jgi:hypothetical protein
MCEFLVSVNWGHLLNFQGVWNALSISPKREPVSQRMKSSSIDDQGTLQLQR